MTGISLNVLTFAQLDTFNLKMYKLPEMKRFELTTSLNEASSSNKNYLQSNYSNNLNMSYNIAFRFFKNSPKWQLDENISNAANLSTDHSNTSDNKITENMLNCHINSTNRYYFIKKCFVELDGISLISNSNYNYTYNHNYDYYYRNYSSHEKGNSLNQLLEISANIGVGRIEPVQDANLAVYILQDLKKANVLSHDPNISEIVAFSTFISQLKNKRIFDSRTKRIYELEVIDSFLTANNLTNKNDIKTFAIVNDNWAFANNPTRLSGWRSSFGFDFRGNRYESNDKTTDIYTYPTSTSSTSKYDYITKQNVLTIQINNSYEDPINLHWQQSAFVNPFISKYSLTTPQDNRFLYYYNTQTYKKYSYGLYSGYTLSFYPNSRTSVSLNATFTAWKNKRNSKDDASWWTSDNSLNMMPSTGFNLVYYISPRIKLNGNFNLSYIKFVTNGYNANVIGRSFDIQPKYYTSDNKSLSTSSSLQLIFNIL